MIRYSLKCRDGHAFDSWFASADGYDALVARNLVTCAVCGESDVRKALMAPKVGTKAALTTPASALEAKLAALRRKVETEGTYVGSRFADEARKLHDTGASTAIYGEANAQEVRGLLEDGVPIAPLPFLPKSRSN